MICMICLYDLYDLKLIVFPGGSGIKHTGHALFLVRSVLQQYTDREEKNNNFHNGGLGICSKKIYL